MTEPEDLLQRLIYNAINERVREIVALEAKKAAIAVESEVRAQMGSIATKVLSHVNMHARETQLVISVDFKNLRNG